MSLVMRVSSPLPFNMERKEETRRFVWSVRRGRSTEECSFCFAITGLEVNDVVESRGGYPCCPNCLERWIGPVRRKLVEALLKGEQP